MASRVRLFIPHRGAQCTCLTFTHRRDALKGSCGRSVCVCVCVGMNREGKNGEMKWIQWSVGAGGGSERILAKDILSMTSNVTARVSQ